MNSSRSSFLALLISFLAVADSWGAPARPTLHTDTLPDGSVITYRAVGDESFHYFMTADGRPLVMDNGQLRPAASPAEAEAVTTAPARLRKRVASPSRAPQSMTTSHYPSTGSPRSLVILADYSDVKFTIPDVKSYFRGLLNTPGFSDWGATGSALDYFTASSAGLFTPQFDLCGIVTLPNTQKYYGENGTDGIDLRAHEMIIDACDILASQGFDFSPYDCDNDGYIDNVYLFYAGCGESSGLAKDLNTVWPHSWDIASAGGEPRVYNGKILSHYACSNELIKAGYPDGLGAFCHEFSHVIGLPDLYSTGPTGPVTPDQWSVLDVGCYLNDSRTPPVYSAFERMSLGWMTPQTITEAGNYLLRPLDTSNHAYLIATDSDNEFFILENRQKQGWDSYLDGHGMLVWHIDYDERIWQFNTVNNVTAHQRVDIIEALPRTSSQKYSQPTDPFPGTAGITEFTSQTNPAFLSWSGSDPGFPLSEIREEDGLIRFRAGTGGDSGITGIITEDPQITITGAQAINISGTNLPARVYNLTGTLVYSGTARTITLPPGIYIVTVATKTQKVHITG